MFTRILAGTALALGLATSAALAQSPRSDDEDMTNLPPPPMNETIDTGTTGSIYAGQTAPYGTTMQTPCASDPGSMGPDANATPTVNDHYCGK